LLNNHGKFTIGYQLPLQHAFRVAVGDANDDGHPDIYVMRTYDGPGPDIADLLLVSRGSYNAYHTITRPTVKGTVRDDDVYPIDIYRNGKTEFLVLHGHSLKPAPIQVIALQ
jgi:hypothetical protein